MSRILEMKLGKIDSVVFGIQDGKFGLHLIIGCGLDWIAEVGVSYEMDKGTAVQKENVINRIEYMMQQAKVTEVQDLVGKPIMCHFHEDDDTVAQFRILWEVI